MLYGCTTAQFIGGIVLVTGNNGVAHLRIETLSLSNKVIDEVATSLFYSRCEVREYEDVAVFDFDTAKSNFFHAARLGLSAQIEWGMANPTAHDLILDVLCPRPVRGFSIERSTQRYRYLPGDLEDRSSRADRRSMALIHGTECRRM